ncbi:cysteine desulfurase family protein [Emcibacter nanhaiensis]|uniref:Cysteine desulfurase n=1 Tax=Emcibacter nanhaiensis TaxID=1505037 RepID=A0A501PTE8_9PROT|nr:aminotransferase class V-fold PLP-dependent enzyme [Emcibacter nanhaiensis]TPD62981.1 aminotransferase class V-fold PLP-dependent enzyme [Emcibacter nanhaiensis]
MTRPNLPIYLDYQATTPLDERALDVMMPYLTSKFGNPHSINHSFGWEADAGVELAREQIASLIGADDEEVIFTSGATESNNLAIKGMAYALYPDKTHLVTVATEHSCVLESCRALEQSGLAVTYLPVQPDGLLDLDRLRDSITDQTGLVTVMAVNNEIGVIQDIAAIGQICRDKGVVFHTDAAQGVGKIPLDLAEMPVDLMSISGHKLYGPKGIGALYVSEELKTRPLPLMSGGGQERGLRSGTLAPALCAGLGAACALAEKEMEQDNIHVAKLSRQLYETITSELEGVTLNGSADKRWPGNLNLTFSGVKSDLLVKGIRDLAISTGSACSTAKPKPSHVLTALGLDRKQIDCSVRIGFGRMTTRAEVEFAAGLIIDTVRKARNPY